MSIEINQRLLSTYFVVSMGEITFFFKKSFLLCFFFSFFLSDFSAFWKECLELFNLQYRSLENIASRLL